MEIERKTIEKDEKYLRQISKEVDFNDISYKEEIILLENFCLDRGSLALAAIQIGIPKRIVFIRNTDLDELENREHNESRILINPVIISRKGHTKYWEACASCLDYMGLVNRPYEVVIEYFDMDGVKHREKFEGFESTVLSHELDHLDGILHMDIAEEILNMPKDERKEFRKEHPYEIISKTCNYDSKELIQMNNENKTNINWL